MSSLTSFREHLKNGDSYTLIDTDNSNTDDIAKAVTISFATDGSETIPLDEETEFKIDGKPVILKVVIHCWIYKDSSAAEYLADCQNKHLTNIPFLQRNDLINWLTGQSESSEYIALGETREDMKSNDSMIESQKAGHANKNEINGSESSAYKVSVPDSDDPALLETLQHERILMDHNSNLRGSKPINFSYLIKDAELKLVQSIKASLRSKTASGKNSNKGHVSKTGASIDITRKDPIILISSATSSILSLNNIKQFLQDSQYVNPLETPLSTGTDLITVEKKFNKLSKPIRFLVVNNTRMFTKPEYWDRVVAVVTTGHTWQFRDYQWNTPEELFQHCKGYYFHFNGDEVPQQVQQWNVQSVELDKHKRFKDVEVVRFFWNNLEKELLTRGFH